MASDTQTGGVYSPNAQSLMNLLGSRMFYGSHSTTSLPSGTSIFGPDYEGLRGNLQWLMSPESNTRWEGLAQGLDMEGPLGQATEAYGALGERARGLIGTDLKTDISPYVNMAKMLYQQDFLPELKENVSPTYSGFADIGAREAGRRSTELATIAAQLNDPARLYQTEIQGLGALGPMLGQQFAFPMAAGADLMRMGGTQRQMSPQRRAFDIYSALAGIPVQAWFGMGGDDSSTQKFLQSTQAINQLAGAMNTTKDVFSSRTEPKENNWGAIGQLLGVGRGGSGQPRDR